MWCPLKGCSKPVDVDKSDSATLRSATCECGHEFCVLWNNPWHPGRDWPPGVKQFKFWRRPKVRRCTNCHHLVQIQSGQLVNKLCGNWNKEFWWLWGGISTDVENTQGHSNFVFFLEAWMSGPIPWWMWIIIYLLSPLVLIALFSYIVFEIYRVIDEHFWRDHYGNKNRLHQICYGICLALLVLLIIAIPLFSIPLIIAGYWYLVILTVHHYKRKKMGNKRFKRPSTK